MRISQKMQVTHYGHQLPQKQASSAFLQFTKFAHQVTEGISKIQLRNKKFLLLVSQVANPPRLQQTLYLWKFLAFLPSMQPCKVITRHEESDSFLQFHILRFMIQQQMLRGNDSLHLLISAIFRIVRKAMIHMLESILIEADTRGKWQLKVGKQNRFNYCISTRYLQWIFFPSIRRSTIPRIELHPFTADLQAVQSRNPQRFAPQCRRIRHVRLGLYQRQRSGTLSFVHLGNIL